MLWANLLRIDGWITAVVALAVGAPQVCGQCGPLGCSPGGSREIPATGNPPIISSRAPAAACRISVQSPRTVGYGSGVLVAAKGGRGYVATCNHVIPADPQAARVLFPQAGEFAARVLAADRANDLALLEIASPGLRPITVGSATPSSRLTAGGFGGDGRFRAVTGAVLGYARPAGATAASVRIAGAVRPGDSGGPVTNAAGELVGIVWGVRGGVSYATVGEPFRRLLQSIPSASDAGMVRVAPEQSVDREVERRLLSLEGKIKGMTPCQCRGDCLTEDALHALASKDEVMRLEEETGEQHRSVLQRLGEFRAHAAQAARSAALEALSQRIRGSAPVTSFPMPAWLGAALGVGTPMGAAALAGGWWLASRRRRRKQQRNSGRGGGGPRDDPFPRAADG